MINANWDDQVRIAGPDEAVTTSGIKWLIAWRFYTKHRGQSSASTQTPVTDSPEADVDRDHLTPDPDFAV